MSRLTDEREFWTFIKVCVKEHGWKVKLDERAQANVEWALKPRLTLSQMKEIADERQ